ncbi:MAG TPA: hypothetical protein VMB25_09745 [Bryobacteraceae bacterium]|nr:hypothetical protein [Bryobacteraceae bacterium]
MGAGGELGGGVRPRIPPPHPTVDQAPVVLSFKYLDLANNQKFAVQRCDVEFLQALLVELSEICQGKVSDLAEFVNRRHNHQLDFSNTSEPDGFVLPEQVEPEVYWQFAVQEHYSWRVHGFFIQSVFYVVWLDPAHRLCTND